MSDNTIIWSKPRKKEQQYSYNWQPFIEALKAHPGEWGRYPDKISKTLGTYIKRGDHNAFKDGRFEFVTRGDKKNVYLWARYMGDSADAQDAYSRAAEELAADVNKCKQQLITTLRVIAGKQQASTHISAQHKAKFAWAANTSVDALDQLITDLRAKKPSVAAQIMHQPSSARRALRGGQQ